jgi:hypothetical protein
MSRYAAEMMVGTVLGGAITTCGAGLFMYGNCVIEIRAG